MISNEAIAQRQKARATGGMSLWKARPRMKFPAQNRTANVNKMYGRFFRDRTGIARIVMDWFNKKSRI
jgi:hypothetical protein